jgi:membrane protease YdiL (CAAX protease family)
MRPAEALVLGVGLVLQGAAWWLVVFRRRDVWTTTVPVLAACGVAAVLVDPPAWADKVEPVLAAGVGLASGAALYVATRLTVALARPWRTFQRHALAMYLRQGSRSLAAALVLSIALAVPGEELFWRGLAPSALADGLGSVTLGAVAAWAGYVLANLPSANLAIVAGAIVGGGLWGVLESWGGGVLAPLASHAVWTGLMLAFPVVRSEPVE